MNINKSLCSIISIKESLDDCDTDTKASKSDVANTLVLLLHGSPSNQCDTIARPKGHGSCCWKHWKHHHHTPDESIPATDSLLFIIFLRLQGQMIPVLCWFTALLIPLTCSLFWTSLDSAPSSEDANLMIKNKQEKVKEHIGQQKRWCLLPAQ